MNRHPLLAGNPLFFIILFILFLSSANANLEKRNFSLSLNTSIIIPCDYRHFQHLHELFIHYQNQTVSPNEIVISVSESHKISEKDFEELQRMPWSFQLTILRHKDKLSAGANRNRACQASIGDVVICQDADDIPHPQRVEIIKYLFEQYYINHLMHLWIPPVQKFTDYTCEEAVFLSYYSNNIDVLNFWSDDEGKVKGSITNGNVAFIRTLFDTIQWPEHGYEGEGIQFNSEVYTLFPFNVIINAELLIYRNFLSSFLLSN